ncbi:dynamin family protein [Bacillus suaedaesalsae]|uniref:Dynamin family GTPase n=1 Tax=Bacillus suaedaesalsae TaxID=2810349 RepID=A0ABS2DLE5_9BACI|nr:dynamin family protein [Bacillus suaedaesalsae]MBM6619309.1 dynamin family GTPase [Bacillus suaedaesalsae]
MSHKIAAGEQRLTEDNLLTNLTGVYSVIEKSGDSEQSRKMKQLIKKLYDREYSIGFCGHFSAGKSSMINELAGSDILPSSPIPTSANLVKVRSGEKIARVYMFNGEVVEFPAPYDIDEVKKFCMDGGEVEWIEIGTNSSFIPNGVTILDTPGIDSVDDAHRVATESALHLADIIFYMMDYNHVQSEVSFHFTKKLQEMDKPLYLIINQIDKHQESELPFEQFKAGVQQAFHDWGVEPNDIFYTSIREKNHEQNQLSDLKSYLSLVWEKKEDALLQGIVNASKNVIDDHIEFMKDQDHDSFEKWEKELSSIDREDRNNILYKIQQMEQEKSIASQLSEKAYEWFQGELNKVLDNAYIMPFQTRELAKGFMESEQPDFKVGLLFSKQKTEKEKADRLQAFHSDLLEKVQSQIDWHVKELLSKFTKKYSLSETEANELYDLNVTISPDDIRNLVKKGAQVTGDSVLNFTNDVAAECKRKYRNAATIQIESWLPILKVQSQSKITLLTKEIEHVQKYRAALTELKMLETKLNETRESLLDCLVNGPSKNITEVKNLLLESFKDEKKSISNDVITAKPVVEVEEVVTEKTAIPTEEPVKAKDSDYSTGEMITKIESVVDSLQEVRGLQTVIKELSEKATRLKNQSFTVALFGAFSAGKSSFANALIGEKLLPVSPNPTTATINKIKPVTNEYRHGTVRVQVKEEKQMEKDLAFSLKFFDKDFTTISDSLLQIQEILKLEQIEPRQKPHYSFLNAVLYGFDEVKDNFGQLLYVGLKEFEDYVAKEEKSCFVEWIEVYYDCDFTRQGITLVDTPGADSINARHTGVAFEYIKNADAILFVTYYNHAFSKADREFLIQLGRVKDAFELDKMFFMINAADLASSLDELEIVQNYVSSQLLAYGIRNPRLYPISSLLALQEKQGLNIEQQSVMNSSGISKFEIAFKDFIHHELTELTVTSARLDLHRVKNVIREYMETALIGNEEKEHRKLKLAEAQSKINEIISSIQTESHLRAIHKEVKELLYYVKQRVFLRFSDMFNESFHPSVLKDEEKNIKRALNNSLDELLEFVAFDLIQELRATSVRVEGFVKKQLKSVHNQANVDIQNIQQTLQLTYKDPSRIDLLPFENMAEQLSKDMFQKEISSFKNAKTFFEKGGKKQMRDELEKLLQEPVSSYLMNNEENMAEYYASNFIRQLEDWKERAEVEMENYFDGMLEVLSEKIDVEQLKKIEANVTEMIK